MIGFRLKAAALVVALAALAASPARAVWIPQYFLFDRAVWSPDGRSVAVMGRFTNPVTGESFEDTLVAAVDTGRIECASPKVFKFVLSRDARRILGQGPWGLFDHELTSGSTRQLFHQPPFQKIELAAISYDRAADAAVCIRCVENDPTQSGVYSYPVDGGEPRLLEADPACAQGALNYWQSHRRDIPPTPANIPALDRPTIIPRFPGTLWAIRVGTASGVAVWGNGSAPPETLCVGCRVEFASWPDSGGVALVSTSPEDTRDVLSPGDLWLLRPSVRPIHLDRGRYQQAAWPDSSYAFLLSRPGLISVADIPDVRIRPVDLSSVPDWATRSRIDPAAVWTVGIGGRTFASVDSARSFTLAFKDEAGLGFGMEPAPAGSGFVVSVGSAADSGAALRLASSVRKNRALAGADLRLAVHRLPVSMMMGNFDFGSIPSPDGKWRLFFRSHPHMFQRYMSSEVWLEPAGGGRRRQLIEAMANF